MLALFIPVYLSHLPLSSLLTPPLQGALPAHRAEELGEGATLLQRHPLVLLATSLGSYVMPLTHRHMELSVLRSRLPPQNLQGHLRP